MYGIEHADYKTKRLDGTLKKCPQKNLLLLLKNKSKTVKPPTEGAKIGDIWANIKVRRISCIISLESYIYHSKPLYRDWYYKK